MKVKNSKFIKFVVVCLVCVFCFFGLNCVVNADSINNTPDYQYLKTSYYNWDSITWSTDDYNFVTGSNDTFSSLENFNDYYQISQVVDIPNGIPTDLTGYTIFVPTGWSASSGYGSFSLLGKINNVNFYDEIGNFGIGFNQNNIAEINSIYLVQNPFGTLRSPSSMNNGVSFSIYIVGGDDADNIDLIEWFVDNNATFTHNTGDASIDDEISLLAEETEYYTINRSNVYNTSLSSIDTFVYDSVLNTDLIFNSIVFEKNNFFMKVGDLNNLSVPMISASVLSGGYDITFEINGFVRDVNGDVRDLSIVTDERIDVLGYQTLYPTFQELFGNVGSINNDCMMYINNIRVLVEFPNNYVDNLSYRYSVSSIESNNIKYGGAFNSWVNSSINTNLGSSLVDNINTFLQIEILPGLSFFGILLLAVAVPMLIWILKIFFGG